jgi:hypothetical protein
VRAPFGRLMLGRLTMVVLAALLATPAARAQSASATRALSFGKFVAQSGGSVTVSPTGARSAAGSVLLIASGPGTSAAFQVSDPEPANSDRSFIISLPPDGSVMLTGPSGSMPVDQFTSEPSETGTLVAGARTIQVGATLGVGANQPAGSYSGSFPLIINYQ